MTRLPLVIALVLGCFVTSASADVIVPPPVFADADGLRFEALLPDTYVYTDATDVWARLTNVGDETFQGYTPTTVGPAMSDAPWETNWAQNLAALDGLVLEPSESFEFFLGTILPSSPTSWITQLPVGTPVTFVGLAVFTNPVSDDVVFASFRQWVPSSPSPVPEPSSMVLFGTAAVSVLGSIRRRASLRRSRPRL